MDLRGSTVRDNAGAEGRIVALSLPWVRIDWWGQNSREECILRSDPRIEALEILTLGGGWVPAKGLIGAKSLRAESVLPKMYSLLEEQVLTEKARSPYKTARRLGKGPRGAPYKYKRDYWTCSGSNYKYVCKGKEGERKKIKRDPDVKADYNQEYKKWWKAKHITAAPRLKLWKYRKPGSRGIKRKKKAK
jgi:hypothetical protein